MPRTTTVFNNNRTQAVRIPKDMAYPPGTRLTIEKHGDVITLRPVKPSWASFFAIPVEPGDDDFMRERPDVAEQDRFGWMRDKP